MPLWAAVSDHAALCKPLCGCGWRDGATAIILLLVSRRGRRAAKRARVLIPWLVPVPAPAGVLAVVRSLPYTSRGYETPYTGMVPIHTGKGGRMGARLRGAAALRAMPRLPRRLACVSPTQGRQA